ncbi:hypothetical protein GH741_16295 [Aquibacillus halophilus]|uniref:HEAT repeat domain-containing protein n=1 Tax=Aquibacillus halophilus TaxID=930132 RepID=A0A6A8DF21_9BACI|nr:HEAT repeat domain-containing protein [Aquibacillus halophilus]MRH44204.1 hypothetical protein [Aquibacillus halophilus]
MELVTVGKLLYINGTILLLLLLFFCYLVINKTVRTRREHKKKHIQSHIEVFVKNYIYNGVMIPEKVLKDSPLHFEALEHLLYEHFEYVNESEYRERIQQLVKHRLQDYYANLLSHRRMALRLNALYHIEDFKIIGFEEQLLKRFEQHEYENKVEKFQLMRILSNFQNVEFFQEMIREKEEYPKFIYKDILHRFDQSVSVQFVDFFNNIPVNFKKALIEWLGESNQLDYIHFLESKLSEEEVETRISALKALNQLGFVTDVDAIIPFAQSELYQERILFARLAKKIQRQRLKKILLDMVSDQNWFVRQAVAEAIASYPDGNILLHFILDTHDDHFAKDAASQWLEVGEKVWI